MIDYKLDGIDHINVYSKGKTSLGRFLSNFAETNLDIEDGSFASIEGYWYWLVCSGCPIVESKDLESLRMVFGSDAKILGKKLRERYALNETQLDSDLNFRRKIKTAIKLKIEESQYKGEFTASTLPLKHYYVFYGSVKEPKSHHWVIDYLDELRKEYGDSLREQMPTLQKR